MKDFSVIKVRNQNKKDNIFNRFLYWCIWNGSRGYYNHCQLLRSFNGTLYVCESTLLGFRITKTFNEWLIEQKTMQRIFVILDFESSADKMARFDAILGNNYNARYWLYPLYYFLKWFTKKELWLGSKTNITSTNCWQSVAFILGDKDWFKANCYTI